LTFYDSDIEDLPLKKIKLEKNRDNLLLKKLRKISRGNNPIIIEEEGAENLFSFNEKIKNEKIKMDEILV